MKPLSLKEARELEITEKSAALRAANKEAARALLLEMMVSLPKQPYPHERTLSTVRSRTDIIKNRENK